MDESGHESAGGARRRATRRTVRRPAHRAAGLAVGPGLAALLTTALSLAGCSAGGSNGITVAPVGYATVSQVVQASANILPKTQVTLEAPSAGTLADLDVRDGQQVKAGQVLGIVSSPAARQQLAAARQALAQAPSAGSAGAGVTQSAAGFSAVAASDQNSADAAFEQASRDAEKIPDASLRSALLEQIKAARGSFAASMDSLDAAVSAFQQGLGSAASVLDALALTTRTQDQAAVSAAQAAVNALTITAPVSGVVSLGNGQSTGSSIDPSEISQLLAAAESGGTSALSGSGSSGGALGGLGSGSGTGGAPATTVSAGAPVGSGGALFTVTDDSVLSVAAQVDETDVLTVHPGVTASIQLNAVPGASYQGTVTSVDPTASTSSQGSVTYTVRLSLGRGTLPDGRAAPTPLPGMSAIADLNVLTADHALSVPSAALVINGQTTSVWVLTNGAAHLRQIILGAQGDTVVQVLSGLTAGQRIVVSGADKVTDGERLG